MSETQLELNIYPPFTIDDAINAVEEFQKAFETAKDPMLWVKLVNEELEELEQALGNGSGPDVLKEFADLQYVDIGLGLVLGSETTLAKILLGPEVNKRIVNAFVRVYLLYDEPRLLEAFRRVHLSNMSKLGEDGKPVRREDGKILKGPNYKPPFLDDLAKVPA